MKKWLPRLLPIAIIIAACAIYFYPTFTRGLLPVPADTLIGLYHPWLDATATTSPRGVPFKNFLITDPIRQQIPWKKLVIDAWKAGKTPLWNPYNFSGSPLLANIQAGSWYPLNILFFFLPFYVAWTGLIIAQPLLAALFLYFYLRNKKILPVGAAFAGIAWAFCGFSIAWLTWGTIVQTVLWLPLILLAIDKILDHDQMKTRVLWSLTLIASSTFALFAGHAQVALYIFGFAALYGVFQTWNLSDRKNVWWVIISAGVATIISSIQWMPLMRLIGHSSRLINANAWLKDGWFLPWQNLVQFIAPDFFGNPATLNYWGVWNYGEFIGYIGILPLMFAIYAVLTRRDRLTRFFGGLAVLVFLFLLPTPIARLPFQLHIPLLFTLQPTRLMVLVDVCLVVLAALGLETYIRKPDKKIIFIIGSMAACVASLWIYAVQAHLEVSERNLVLPSIIIVASVGIFLLSRWRKLFIALVIGLTIFDLFRFGWKFTPFTPREYFFPTTSAISFLQSQQKPFRAMSLDNRIMPPNVGAYYGIESIEGYDPIYDARYEEFIAALNRHEPNITPPFGFNRIITTSTVGSPLLPLLNVKYILTLDDIHNPDMELMYQEGKTRIYWYKKGLPRIYPVESIVHASSKQEIISMLYDKTFNPAKTAIVEDSVEMPVHTLTDLESVRITSYVDNYLTAVSTLLQDHFVVISNIFDSHWMVLVDGEKVQTYRTDDVLTGFVVPKGNHTIKVSYE